MINNYLLGAALMGIGQMMMNNNNDTLNTIVGGIMGGEHGNPTNPANAGVMELISRAMEEKAQMPTTAPQPTEGDVMGMVMGILGGMR